MLKMTHVARSKVNEKLKKREIPSRYRITEKNLSVRKTAKMGLDPTSFRGQWDRDTDTKRRALGLYSFNSRFLVLRRLWK